MSIEEARAEPGAERTTEIARRNPTDPTVEILGAPRKVRVLAFEPDERRTGEWRARQFALNRSPLIARPYWRRRCRPCR